MLRRARRRVPHVARRGHHAADRGRLPELRAAHPERLPEPAHRRRATRFVEALDRVQIVGQNRDNAAVRIAMSAGGLELSMIGPGRRRTRRSRSTRSSKAPSSPSRSTRTFLRDGVDALETSEVALETIDPLKPATLRARRRRRLPVPARCRCARPEPEPAADARVAGRALWLHRLPLLHATSSSTLAPGLTVLGGDNGQGKTSVLEAVGWVARARSFRGVADARAGARRVPSRRSCGPRSSPATRDAAVRGRDPRRRPQPRPVQQADRGARRATCTACCASRSSHPTTSRW